MVRDPGDFRWSSYRAHAMGAPVNFWTPSDLYLSLGQNKADRQRAWRAGVKEALDIEMIARIRHCANTGLVLGTEKFRAQVATLAT